MLYCKDVVLFGSPFEALFASDGYGDHVGHHQGLGDGPVDGALHHGLQGRVAHQLSEVFVFHGQLRRVQKAQHQAANPLTSYDT